MVYDAVIIGGGPSGATTALLLARRGLHVVVIEKETFPRFHVGESFLPQNQVQLRRLGLLDRVRQLPHVRKIGAEFAFGDGDSEPRDFYFEDALDRPDRYETFNLERAPFDRMLLDAAREAGAEVREGARVDEIRTLRDGEAVVSAGEHTVRAHWLVDASGGGAVVGRHLNRRRLDPELRKVAYFGHLTGVARREGEVAGFPTIVMCRDGWFWLIPIDEERTSVGLVMDDRDARQIEVPASEMLSWGIRRCPEMERRCQDATLPRRNRVTSDFSYSCQPYAGPGHFLLGDAAIFVDPIFSTGLCLGMMAAERVADEIAALRVGSTSPGSARRRYRRYVDRSSGVFFRLVRAYYRHGCRELFMHGRGPLHIHRAVLAVLAGHVFPRTRFSVRWRLRVFLIFVRLQRWIPIVPRRHSWSLLHARPAAP